MNKYTKHLICLLLLLSVVNGYAQKTYFMNDTLNGQIKSIKFKTNRLNNPKNENDDFDLDLNYYRKYTDGTTYTFNFDKSGNNIFEQDWDKNYEKKFNSKNQLIETLTYTLGDETTRKLLNKTTYSYEKDKVKTTKFYNYYIGKECLYQEFVYEFDNKLNIIAIITNLYECGVMNYTTREEFKYNSDNKKIEKKSYNRFIGNSTIVEYIYDKNNELYKEIQRNGSNNEIEKQTLFEYDKKTNTKSITQFDASYNITKKETFKYDNKKHLIDKKLFLKDELISQRVYSYRENKLLEEMYHKKSAFFYKKVFTYDSIGNIIQCIYYDDKNIAKRKYEITIEYY